ncbi:MAG: PP2C family protein-serine/threonine phosphatase [Thainema sp.]
MAQILVIDEDPAILLLAQRSLSHQGYEVALANNGEEGVRKAKSLRPAVVLCDQIMQGLSGLEVCQQIKADPALSTTFIILLTARTDIQDRIEGFDSGADDFLTKPVDVNEMNARIRAAMRLYRLNQDLVEQKRLLEAELHEASDYVRSLLPKPANHPIKVECHFLPSLQLGGDCFDYYWLDPDYLLIFLLDVSGHGLGAALPSVTILNLLRSQMLPDVNFYRPETVLATLNENFQMTEQHNKYFTIWYGVYNCQTRQLLYASAGHPPAILVSDQVPVHVQRLDTPNPPIGFFSDVMFVSDRCTIPEQSLLYIFSDGIYDGVNLSNAKDWGLDRFVELISQQPSESLESLLDQVKTINQTQTFPDDLSLLRFSLP